MIKNTCCRKRCIGNELELMIDVGAIWGTNVEDAEKRLNAIKMLK